LPGGRLASVERNRWKAVAQREGDLGRSCLGVSLVSGDHPDSISVLVLAPLLDPDLGFSSLGVDAGGADPETHPPLPHQIGEVHLRGAAQSIASKMRVLRR